MLSLAAAPSAKRAVYTLPSIYAASYSKKKKILWRGWRRPVFKLPISIVKSCYHTSTESASSPGSQPSLVPVMEDYESGIKDLDY